MTRFAAICFWVLCGVGYVPLKAQSDDEIARYRYQDTLARAPRVRFLRQVRPSERFDLFFNRGFLIGTGLQPDSVPFKTAQSGTYLAGISFNFWLGKRWIWRVQPCAAFFVLTFDARPQKKFPNFRDSLSSERLRTDYLEIHNALSFVFSYDSVKKRTTAWVDAGVCLGVNVGGRWKINTFEGSRRAVVTLLDVPGLHPLRAGVFVKLAYRFA
ncbi:MAG: hypothetical protein NZ534_05670, partial [Bacteroidia bacterium]|nr:hypothetical protein [Bacteroidia bacterium]